MTKKLMALLICTFIVLGSFGAVFAAGTVTLLYPQNGMTVYGDNTITFTASVSGAASAPAFTLDGKSVGTGEINGTKYELSFDASGLSAGAHTLTAVSGTETDTVLFSYLPEEIVLFENEFDDSSSTVAGNFIPAGIGAADVNGIKFGFDEGMNGTTGLRFTTEGDSTGFPTFWIFTDILFFGKAVTGNGSGLTEGIVKTEFDIKIDSKTNIALLHAGNTSNSATSSNSAIFSSSGVVSGTDISYDLGVWKHVAVVADLTNKWYYVSYDGNMVKKGQCDYGFGSGTIGNSAGIKFQSNGSSPTDYSIDNFKVSFVNAMSLGSTDFTGAEVTDSLPWNDKLTFAFWPKTYTVFFCDNPVSDTVKAFSTAAEGRNGSGDAAYKIVPNGTQFVTYRKYYGESGHYPASNIINGISEGVATFEADFKFDKNDTWATKLSEGWGLAGNDRYLFTTGGEIYNSDFKYVPGEWYRIKLVADYNSKSYVVLCNGKFIRKGKLLDDAKYAGNYSTLQFECVNRVADAENGITLDNLNSYYYNTPQVSSVAYKNAEDDGFKALSGNITRIKAGTTEFKLTLSKAFADNLSSENAAVYKNGERLAGAELSADGAVISVSLPAPAQTGDFFEVRVNGSVKLANFVSDTANARIIGKETSYGVVTVQDGFTKLVLVKDGSNAHVRTDAYFDEMPNSMLLLVSYAGNRIDKINLIKLNSESVTLGEYYKLNVDLSELVDDTTEIKAFAWESGLKPVAAESITVTK